MKACNCTLPYTNPDACKYCTESTLDVNSNNWYPYEPYTVPQYPTKMVKRTTKTIEKWGPEGEYLGKEVITTDEEDIEVQDWKSSGTIVINYGDNSSY